MLFYKYEEDIKNVKKDEILKEIKDDVISLSKKQSEKIGIIFLAEKLAEDVKDILQDKDFERAVRAVASALGVDCTLSHLKLFIDYFKHVPEKDIDGKIYKAGYSGFNIIDEGGYTGVLVDVTTTKTEVKLMFVINGLYLFHNLKKDSSSFEEVVALTKSVGSSFSLNVKHEVLPNGEHHAAVANFVEIKK